MATKRRAAKQTERELRVIAAEKENERLDRLIVTVIRASLVDADVTHQELADRLGLTRVQVTNMMRRRRAIHASHFIMIARALKLDPRTLLDRVLSWSQA